MRQNQQVANSKKAKKDTFSIFDYEPTGGRDHYSVRAVSLPEDLAVVDDNRVPFVDFAVPFVMHCDLFL